jgi:hypothetical protein
MAVINLLRQQLDALRRLDRQMGAIVAYDEVCTKIDQVHQLHAYSLTPTVRTALAGVLAELNALAGWQALDRYELTQAWDHHEHAKQAASTAESVNLYSHALAQQASILTDLGQINVAVDQLAAARRMVKGSGPTVLRAWLAAAHGEGLANANSRVDALRAFDSAETLRPADSSVSQLPFLFLKSVHLQRWRGQAMSRFRDTDAISVLTSALNCLDPTFTRAEAALRVDLAAALMTEREVAKALYHLGCADALATNIGSVRQKARVRKMAARSQISGGPRHSAESTFCGNTVAKT